MSKEAKLKTEKHKKPKSFGFKVFRFIALALVAAIVICTGANVIINKDFGVSFYQVRCDKVTDNIRVVELADLHNAEYGKGNSKLVEKIKGLKPDLIFFAGDMMNYKDSDYSVFFNLCDDLNGTAPIYACFGNNELDQYLFEDKGFKDAIISHGVNLLSNEATEITVGSTTIELIAVTEGPEQYDIPTNNAKKFVESLEPTYNCRICLTHYPELFADKLLNKGIDIAFTGHAHGGHIRLPKIGGLYSNGEGFLPKFTSGVVKTDDETQVVVSRGLGNHNLIPRINNKPELVVVDICWY